MLTISPSTVKALKVAALLAAVVAAIAKEMMQSSRR